MANAHNYLVVVFCTTAGQRGALLGTDETDLVLLVWGVIDVETNKVGYHSCRVSLYKPGSIICAVIRTDSLPSQKNLDTDGIQ